jgi:hypothetical protein
MVSFIIRFVRLHFSFSKRLSHNKFCNFFQLGPYLLWKNYVHGPAPYKKVPHQQFLAPYSVVCLYGTQIWSVSLCRHMVA